VANNDEEKIKEQASKLEAMEALLEAEKEKNRKVSQEDIKLMEDYAEKLKGLGDSERARLTQAEHSKAIAEEKLKMIQQELQGATKLYDDDLKRLEVAEKQVKVADENIKKVKGTTKAIKEGVAAATELGANLGSAFAAYGKHQFFNTENATKLFKAFKGGTKSMGAFIGSLATAGITSFIDTMIQLIFLVDSFESDIKKATGAGDKFARMATEAYDDVRLMTVPMEDVSKAAVGLFNDFTNFSMENENVQKQLTKTVAVLGRWGVSADSAAKSMQFANKVLGQTPSVAGETLLEMEALAEDIGVAPSKLIDQFAQMGPQLAKLGAAGEKAFKDLARVSKITGLEMEKLLAITDKFDTFEGAAEMTGKLNAALGGNFVNAMDLMTATDPVERFDQIRGAIENAGLSFDEMSYYQRKFYADSLGLSNVGDLALLLSGDMSALGDDIGKTSSDYKDAAQRAQEMATLQEKLQAILMEFVPILLPILDKLHEWLDAFMQDEEAIEELRTDIENFFDKLQLLGDWLDWIVKHWKEVLGVYILITQAGPLVAGALGVIGRALARLAFKQQKYAKISKKTMRAMRMQIPLMLSLGAAAFMIGAGIAIAALGLAKLVTAFSGLGAAAEPAAYAVIGFTIAFGALMLLLAGMVTGPQAVIAAGAVSLLMAVGFAALMMGGGVALAAIGLAEMLKAIPAEGLSRLEKFAEVMAKVAFSLTLLAGALVLLGQPLAVAGAATMGAIALGLGALANVIMDKIEPYIKPLATILSAMQDIDAAGIGDVETAFENITTSINKIQEDEANAIAAALNAASSALTAAKVLGLGNAVVSGAAAAKQQSTSTPSKDAGLKEKIELQITLDAAQTEEFLRGKHVKFTGEQAQAAAFGWAPAPTTGGGG